MLTSDADLILKLFFRDICRNVWPIDTAVVDGVLDVVRGVRLVDAAVVVVAVVAAHVILVHAESITDIKTVVVMLPWDRF
jgi:hypothetical protein